MDETSWRDVCTDSYAQLTEGLPRQLVAEYALQSIFLFAGTVLVSSRLAAALLPLMLAFPNANPVLATAAALVICHKRAWDAGSASTWELVQALCTLSAIGAALRLAYCFYICPLRWGTRPTIAPTSLVFGNITQIVQCVDHTPIWLAHVHRHGRAFNYFAVLGSRRTFTCDVRDMRFIFVTHAHQFQKPKVPDSK